MTLNSLQIIDTLQAGGAERMAINYANGLSNLNINSHLCSTRFEGPLLQDINDKVSYIFLKRKRRLDITAFLKLRRYILNNNIDIIHAHSSSFFIGTVMKVMLPHIKLVWHDHYGNSEFLQYRPKRMLKICSHFFSQILSVNESLRDWSVRFLHCSKVRFIKNFPVLDYDSQVSTSLNGDDKKRVLCLANLRPQKNQINLLRAFKQVNNKHKDWTLHLVGKDFEDDYSKQFFTTLNSLGLQNFVYFYGSRPDILNIMHQCQIGVLVSKSEGLPMVLLEYGKAGLSVISTDVGDCSKLIPDKSYGVLLSNDEPNTITDAIVRFIENKLYREESALKFQEAIKSEYSEYTVLSEVVDIYRTLV